MGNFKVLLVLLLTTAAAAAEKLPNIVYILCDDLGYGEVHCLNPERGKVPTPHIDKLGSGGMIFTDAHSGAAVCTPTRYGILTGRYAWRTRLQSGVATHSPKDQPLIAADRLTVPALLKRSGYHSAAIGKWHLVYHFLNEAGQKTKTSAENQIQYNAKVPVGTQVEASPVTRGFDYYLGFHHSRVMATIVENESVIDIKPVNQTLQYLGDNAVDYVTTHAKSDNPFFLYLALNSPHTPIAPSKDWIGKSGMGEYCDFVMETDYVVGRVLTALDETGVADNTLVIFTSDNGCSAGPAKAQNLQDTYGHYPSANLRGYKSDGWDGGHRVPFIARWPGKVKAGSTHDQPVCLTSLMATCAELTGQKLADNEGEDSVSILPVLQGKTTEPTYAMVVHHSIAGKFAIRKGKWKLCFFPGSGGWTSPKDNAARQQDLPELQLYDMQADVGEQNNVADQYPDVVKELTEELEILVANGRTTPGESQKNDVSVDFRKQKK